MKLNVNVIYMKLNIKLCHCVYVISDRIFFDKM